MFPRRLDRLRCARGRPSFEQVVREKLFGPLNTNETLFKVWVKLAADLVTMVDVKSRMARPIDPGRNSGWLNAPTYQSGGRGLVASAHDYHRFVNMLAGEDALGRRRIMSARAARFPMSDVTNPGVDRGRIVSPGFVSHGAGRALGGQGPNRDCSGGWGAGHRCLGDRRDKVCRMLQQQFFPPEVILPHDEFTNAVQTDLPVAR